MAACLKKQGDSCWISGPKERRAQGCQLKETSNFQQLEIDLPGLETNELHSKRKSKGLEQLRSPLSIQDRSCPKTHGTSTKLKLWNIE